MALVSRNLYEGLIHSLIVTMYFLLNFKPNLSSVFTNATHTQNVKSNVKYTVHDRLCVNKMASKNTTCTWLSWLYLRPIESGSVMSCIYVAEINIKYSFKRVVLNAFHCLSYNFFYKITEPTPRSRQMFVHR